MGTINKLLPLEEVANLIKNNHQLIIAAEEELLNLLPKGYWIGGTIPYFMDINGGTYNTEKLFVTDVSDYAIDFKIKTYNKNDLTNIVKDRFENGLSYILIPGFSNILEEFALKIHHIEGLYEQPLAGWVTGMNISESTSKKAKVFNGQTLSNYEEATILLFVKLKETQYAKLEILNIFKTGNGDIITFLEDGFKIKNCLINNKVQNFADYLRNNNFQIQLPLIADYSGALINTSFKEINNDEVILYSPVRKDLEYRIAAPIANYIKEFQELIPANLSANAFSCNCIHNYIYSELHGKKTGELRGPFTFGEIAYVLINQTLVYLSIEE